MVKASGGKGPGGAQGKKEQAVRLPAGQGLEVFEDGRRSCLGTVVRFNTKKANHKIVYKEGNEWKTTRKDLRPPVKYALVERPEEEKEYALKMAEELEEEAKSGGAGEGEVVDDGTSAPAEISETGHPSCGRVRGPTEDERSGPISANSGKGAASQRKAAEMDGKKETYTAAGKDSEADQGRKRMIQRADIDAGAKAAGKKGRLELAAKVAKGQQQKSNGPLKVSPPLSGIPKAVKASQQPPAVSDKVGKKRNREMPLDEVELQQLAQQRRLQLEEAIEDDLETRELRRMGEDEGAGIERRDGDLLYAGLTPVGRPAANLGMQRFVPGIGMDSCLSGQDGRLEAGWLKRGTAVANLANGVSSMGFSWQRWGRDTRSGRSRKPRGTPWMAAVEEEAPAARPLVKERAALAMERVPPGQSPGAGIAGEPAMKRGRDWSAVAGEGRVQQRRATRPVMRQLALINGYAGVSMHRQKRSPTHEADAGPLAAAAADRLAESEAEAGIEEGLAGEVHAGSLWRAEAGNTEKSSAACRENEEESQEEGETESVPMTAATLASFIGSMAGIDVDDRCLDGLRRKGDGIESEAEPMGACHMDVGRYVDVQAAREIGAANEMVTIECSSNVTFLQLAMEVDGAGAPAVAHSKPASQIGEVGEAGEEGAGADEGMAGEEKKAPMSSKLKDAVLSVEVVMTDVSEGKEKLRKVGGDEEAGKIGSPEEETMLSKLQSAELKGEEMAGKYDVSNGSTLLGADQVVEPRGTQETSIKPGLPGIVLGQASGKMTDGCDSEVAGGLAMDAGLGGASCAVDSHARDQAASIELAEQAKSILDTSEAKEASEGVLQSHVQVAVAAHAWRAGTGLGMRLPDAVGRINGVLLNNGLATLVTGGKTGKYTWCGEMSPVKTNGAAAKPSPARGIPGALASRDNGVSPGPKGEAGVDERGLQTAANNWWLGSQGGGSCSANGGLHRERGLSSDSSEKGHSRLCEGLAR